MRPTLRFLSDKLIKRVLQSAPPTLPQQEKNSPTGWSSRRAGTDRNIFRPVKRPQSGRAGLTARNQMISSGHTCRGAVVRC